MNNGYEEPTVKHRKKRKKKHNPRADHKHTYELCVLNYSRKSHITTIDEPCSEVAEYCTICGKVNEIGFLWFTERLLNKYGITENEVNQLRAFSVDAKNVYATKWVNLES